MNKTPFRQLKTALLILSSNYSTVMQEIRNSKELGYRRVAVSSCVTSWKDNNTIFRVRIDNDYLPDVELCKEGNFFKITYDSMVYYFNKDGVSFYDRKLKSITVDMKDVDSKTDMFSLSTIRDFYDLEYNDVVTLRELISDCDKILCRIIKHV